MTYYYFRYCPSSGKCTIIVVYTLHSHSQSPTFKYITNRKYDVIRSLELWQIAWKFIRQIRYFGWRRARYKISQMIATAIDYTRNCKVGAQNVYIAIPGCRSLSQLPGSVSSSCAWSKTPDLPLELSSYLSYFQTYKYFRFWRPCHYFRLSFDVTVTYWLFLWARPGRKPQVCRRNLMISVMLSEI